jgi:hypothetical protein
MVISYCCVLSNRRKEYALLQDQVNQQDAPAAI